MKSFKEVVSTSNQAFGVKIAGASNKVRIKELKEDILRIGGKANEIMCKKYYAVPKEYEKVQWKAFFGGWMLSCPMYWTIMSVPQYWAGIASAISGKCNMGAWIMGNIWLSLATIFLLQKSKKEIAKGNIWDTDR